MTPTTDLQKLLNMIDETKDSRRVWHHSLDEAEQALENAAREIAARVIELQAENKRLREGLAPDLTDTEAEDALTSEGIGTWGSDGERFERMFAVVMKARAALKGGEI
jgi:hypothetical protein